jgi:hypothetical protein
MGRLLPTVHHPSTNNYQPALRPCSFASPPFDRYAFLVSCGPDEISGLDIATLRYRCGALGAILQRMETGTTFGWIRVRYSIQKAAVGLANERALGIQRGFRLLMANRTRSSL